MIDAEMLQKEVKMIYDLSGQWTAKLENGIVCPIRLPGTLDENGIGEKDEGKNQWHPDITLGNLGLQAKESHVIATRYTRRYTWEGPVVFERIIDRDFPEGERLFLEVERARVLRLSVGETEVPHFRTPCLNSPQVFEVTGLWKKGKAIRFTADNSFPGLPQKAILNSSAATDETQTNWNGLLGYLRLRTEQAVFVESLRVYPCGESLKVQAEVQSDQERDAAVTIVSGALRTPERRKFHFREGRNILELHLPVCPDRIPLWDEEEGNLCSLTMEISGNGTKTVSFGMRTFAPNKAGRLALNGRTIFLRSEANCAVFPETGHPPMDREAWEKILTVYRSYGVNCVRFHSWCPPEAAFDVADRMGMLMQPELSHWAPGDAFESEESIRYYRTELEETLRMLANHPSFVMLTFGNELAAHETGHERMRELLKFARQLDDTRLYAEASNPHYGELGCEKESDFYTAQQFRQYPLRATFADMKGYLNHSYPGACTDYSVSMEELRKEYDGPVFSFEVGQYEVLPEFGELDHFRGVCLPENLSLIRRRVEECGLLPVWGRYVEATGELSRIGYREEVESVLRTGQMSGISLLGLQDFPGQGTALVGMLNSHLEAKPFPFAEPEAFRSFFADRLPLVLLEKYTYENTETLTAPVRIANYGKSGLRGDVCCELSGKDFRRQIILPDVYCPQGELTDAGQIRFGLEEVSEPVRLELTVSVGEIRNSYPVWVYPPVHPVCPEGICVSECLDEKVRETLRAGGKVYLTPRSVKEDLPSSVQAQFTTDFWSVGTFARQEGCMGQLIDDSHPLFRNFPTEFHTNWQWWPMAVQRAVILPEAVSAIITEMDSYAWLRPMAQLFEFRCGGGTVLFSSMGLQDLQQYPEARALLAAIYSYLDSDSFRPEQELSMEALEKMIRTEKYEKR